MCTLRMDRRRSVSAKWVLPILVLFWICFQDRALGQSTTWKGGSGNWTDSTKWTSGVPNSGTNALIDNGNPVASP